MTWVRSVVASAYNWGCIHLQSSSFGFLRTSQRAENLTIEFREPRRQWFIGWLLIYDDSSLTVSAWRALKSCFNNIVQCQWWHNVNMLIWRWWDGDGGMMWATKDWKVVPEVPACASGWRITLRRRRQGCLPPIYPPVTWVCTIRAIFLLCTTHPYLQRNQETLWAIWRHNWQSNHTLGATLIHIKKPSKCPSMWVCPPESGEFAAIDKNHLSHWYTCHLKPLFLCRRGCRKLWTDDGRCGGRWTQDKCTGIQKIETLRSCVYKPWRHAI